MLIAVPEQPLDDLDLRTLVKKLDLPWKVAVSDLRFNRDGSGLAIATELGNVGYYSFEKDSLRSLEGPTQYVLSVAISPDGKLLAAGGRDSAVFVWDLTGSRPFPSKLDMPGKTNRLAFRPDGNELMAGSDGLYLQGWDTHSWKTNFLWFDRVGIRSVFDFHPKRGDLAFDGGLGIIRILRAGDQVGNFKPQGKVYSRG